MGEGLIQKWLAMQWGTVLPHSGDRFSDPLGFEEPWDNYEPPALPAPESRVEYFRRRYGAQK